MKILNLYAGLGGNRKLWGEEHEITAVEIHPDICKYYKNHYPKDNIFNMDCINYLETIDSLDRFDFIWASPPCQTHSKLAIYNAKRVPDMTGVLGIQIFLDKYYDGLYVIENVQPYWLNSVMIDSHLTKLGRHCFWSNFPIPYREFERTKKQFPYMTINDLSVDKEIDIPNIEDKTLQRQTLRNCVHPKIGKYILDCAMKKVKTLDDYVSVSDIS